MIDSVLWIIFVVVGAGNMIIGGLYETVVDVSAETLPMGLLLTIAIVPYRKVRQKPG